MIKYNEDKVCDNIYALTEAINNVYDRLTDSKKLSSDETRQYKFYNDYFFWGNFSNCANEKEASLFLNKNGIDFSEKQVKELAEFIGVLVYIIIKNDDISSFYKAGNGLWDFSLWQCNSSIPAVTLQAFTLHSAIWEYDNCYLQGGSGWISPYLPDYNENDDGCIEYCEISNKCINMYNRIKEKYMPEQVRNIL